MDDPSQYQAIVDAEWNIIYEKLDRCVESGAQVGCRPLPPANAIASWNDLS